MWSANKLCQGDEASAGRGRQTDEEGRGRAAAAYRLLVLGLNGVDITDGSVDLSSTCRGSKYVEGVGEMVGEIRG